MAKGLGSALMISLARPVANKFIITLASPISTTCGSVGKFNEFISFAFLHFRAVKNLSYFMTIQSKEPSELTFAVHFLFPRLTHEQSEAGRDVPLRPDWV